LHHRATLRLFGISALRAICWMGTLTYLGAFLAEEQGLSTRQVGLAYMVGGSGYFLGSLAASGRLGGFPLRPLVAASLVGLAALIGLTFGAGLEPAPTVAALTAAAFVGAVGWVGLTTLLTTESPAGAGTTMVLNGTVFNLGAAGGGAVGGGLLALGGYGALAVGLPAFALLAAALAWAPPPDVRQP
jgi:predicted MFS family arabinose efflux permease